MKSHKKPVIQVSIVSKGRSTSQNILANRLDGLETPAVDAPIDLTWRTVDAYQKVLGTTTWGRPVRTKGRSLILA